MPVIVVGGSACGVGKTALVCALIRALPEFAWTAVKITGHGHGRSEAIREETIAGEVNDTARYLAAGAKRALLVTAPDCDFVQVLQTLRLSIDPGTPLILESNRIVDYLQPDVCLAVDGEPGLAPKPSYARLREKADAILQPTAEAQGVDGSRPVFAWASAARVSPALQQWIRLRFGLA
ncbi:MAG: hypothetical protein WCA37_00185 [Terracidiphilus sp.]